LFHNIYSVRVSTELLPVEIDSYYQVQTVVNDVTVLPPQL